jgi:hypothetical protein
MRSEIMDAVTIYEVNGVKYTGQKKVIVSHPRFLSFVRLCIDNSGIFARVGRSDASS